MDSPFPAGPEAAPASPTSQPVTSPTPTPQPSSSSTAIPLASSASIVVFLSLVTLATLVSTIWWIRRRRTIAEMPDGRPLEQALVWDVEALAATRPVVPVTPLPDVRWTPQVRSISGPAPDEDEDRKPAPPYSRHARSPPPSNPTKPRSLFPDPHPNPAPARALSLSHNENLYSEKNWGEELGCPVTPRALAVSGMQTRSLGKPGPGLKG